MTTAYLVTLETRDAFSTDAYLDAAGQLSNALFATLGTHEKLCLCAKVDSLESPRVEVEIAQSEPKESASIIARAIVRNDAKMTFDKNTFSAMVRAELPFQVNVSKRMVPKEDLGI